MAHFYVSTENSRGGQVTASGNKSGQTTHCRGWNSGIQVQAIVHEGKDQFHVYATKGSNGSGANTYLGTLEDGEWIPWRTAPADRCPDCEHVHHGGPCGDCSCRRTYAEGEGIA